MIDPQTGTYECDEAFLDQLTGIKRNERCALMAWLSKSGEPTILEAVRKQSEFLWELQGKKKKDPTLAESYKTHRAEHNLSALIRAVNQLRHIDKELMKRKRDGEIDLDKIGEIMNHRVAQVKATRAKKASPQRDKFKSKYYAHVAKLRVRGLSWRDCAEYMKKFHGCKYTHTWLRNNYESVRNERILAGIDAAEIEQLEVET